MPRYYFHLRDGTELIDDAGLELADVNEAKALAVVSAGEAIRDLGPKFWDHPEWVSWVTDENGDTVCTLKLSVGGPS